MNGKYHKEHQKTSPLVYAVVLHFGSPSVTLDCLESLRKIRYPSMDVLLVDNDPVVRFPPHLATRFNNVEVLKVSENRGFSAGCNEGIRLALARNAEFVWLLNNDTIVDTNSLASMVECATADERVGVVGSKLLSWHAPFRLQAFGGGKVSFLSGLPAHSGARSSEELDYICAASMLIRGGALTEAGLLDEDFFLYWEDTDLCFRLRSLGWKLEVAAESVVFHRESNSAIFQSAFYDYHFSLSSIRFFRRHCRFWPFPVMVSLGGRMLCRAVALKGKNFKALWRALVDASCE